MTPERQRIVIAELQGFKGCADSNCGHRKCQHLHRDGKVYFPEPFSVPMYPDYPRHLDAMHEVEKVYFEKWNSTQIAEYGMALQSFFYDISLLPLNPDLKYQTEDLFCDVARLAHATAAQRAEAFLKCIGKWEE